MDRTSSHKKRLLVFRLAWIPLSGIMVGLIGNEHGMTVRNAVAVAVPLSALAQFIALSAWYSCRVTPIHRSTAWRIIATHIMAAQVLGFLWVGVGLAWAYALGQLPPFAGIYHQFAPQFWTVYWLGSGFYLISVAIHYVFLVQEDSKRAEAQLIESRILARDAELKALKAQVNPHFLFNSLNSVSALTSTDPARAREMCILLADFLRMTLGMSEKASVPLETELSLIQKFLAIEKVRYGSRLSMKEEIDDASAKVQVPPLLLQPLVENAVGHGIANLLEGGEIRVSAQSGKGRLSIAVENDFDPETAPPREGGMGLANVRKRVEARYGREGSVRVKSEGHTFGVYLSFPAEIAETPA